MVKVENVNPHGWWTVDVREADGKVTNWRLETPGLGGLINQGLKVKTDLKVGEAYTIKLSPGWKDPAGGQKIGIVRTIVVNGKEPAVRYLERRDRFFTTKAFATTEVTKTAKDVWPPRHR